MLGYLQNTVLQDMANARLSTGSKTNGTVLGFASDQVISHPAKSCCSCDRAQSGKSTY